MSQEFTLEELRVIKSALNAREETSEIKELGVKVASAVDDILAGRHLVETGSYPSWYRTRR